MTTVVPDRKGARRLTAFERAVVDHAFLGAIPLFSDDPEEQAAIDHERSRIINNYCRKRAAMLDHMNAQALTIVDLTEQLAEARRQQGDES